MQIRKIRENQQQIGELPSKRVKKILKLILHHSDYKQTNTNKYITAEYSGAQILEKLRVWNYVTHTQSDTRPLRENSSEVAPWRLEHQ